MNDDQLANELRRRAGRADVPDLLPAVRSAIDTRPQPVPASRWAPLAGLAGIAAVLVLLVIVLPRLNPGPGASPTPGRSGGPITSSISDTARGGDFSVTISSPRSVYRVGEPIEVAGSLLYDGSEPEITVNGHYNLGVEQVDGYDNLEMVPVVPLVCGPARQLRPGVPTEIKLPKSGGFAEDDPDADFWQAYFEEPQLLLPEGRWKLVLWAEIGCRNREFPDQSLTATITVTIEPAEPITQTPDPTAAPSPETRTLDCGSIPNHPFDEPSGVRVNDSAGLIESCQAEARLGPWPEDVGSVFVRPTGDLYSPGWIEIAWLTERCNPEQVVIEVESSGDSYSIRVISDRRGSDFFECGSLRVPEHALLELTRPVDTDAIEVSLEVIPIPQWPPPLDPPPTRTIDCSFIEPVAGQPASVRRMPVTLHDQTGLIEHCITGWNRNPGPAALLESTGSDESLSLSWRGMECDVSAGFVFRRDGSGYLLDGQREIGSCTGEVRYFVLIKFTQAVAANGVTASVDGVPAARPSPTPVLPDTIDCTGAPASPESGSVSIADHTGSVTGCAVTDGPNPPEASITFAGAPPRLIVEWIVPCSNGDPLVSRIELWHREPTGGPTDPSQFQPPYLLMVNRSEPEGSYVCRTALSGRTVELQLRDSIFSGDVEMFFTDGAGRGMDTKQGDGSVPNLELSITANQTEYTEGEAIEVSSALVADSDVTLNCGGIPRIAMEQLDGPLDWNPGPILLVCPPPREMRGGEPLTSVFSPQNWANIESSPLDPYLRDGKLYLPPGTYRFFATSDFGVGERPDDSRVELEASVIVTVR